MRQIVKATVIDAHKRWGVEGSGLRVQFQDGQRWKSTWAASKKTRLQSRRNP